MVQGNQPGVKIFALGGNDRITLNRTDDLGGGNFVDAGNGNDQVANLKEGGNVVKLGGGNDVYAGSGFASFASERGDTVSGGAGKDQFFFETFKSLYKGEAGNDQFFSVGWQNSIDGGAGTDMVSYQFRHEDTTIGDTGVIIDLFSGRVTTGTSRTEFLNSIENAVGSIHADEIGGTNDANVLHGFDGNDEIAGFGGNDTIIGGKGADTLAGDGGNVFGADTFVYTSVQDSPALQNAFDQILDFQSGVDKIDLSALSGRGNFQFVGTNGFSGSGSKEIALDSGFVLVDTNGDATADLAIFMNNGATPVAGDFIL
jgi:Ca2+-binding RTX toxin-like protein